MEIEDPYATSVDFHFLSYLHGSTLLMFEGVPTEKLELVRQHFFDVLSKHVAAGIDMDRMHLVMDRMRLQTLSGVESHASDFFAQ